MCNLYSITTNQAAIIELFRVVNRYVGNLASMPGRFSRLSGPCNPQHRDWQRASHDALGHAATATHGWPARHQHPQHILAALARLAQAGEQMLGPSKQL